MTKKIKSTNQEQIVEETQPVKNSSKTFGGLTKYGIMLLTVAVTAILTWYINFKLSHLSPVISITNIEFIYDLEGIKDIIEIPEDLINKDKEGFFGTNLKYFMRLEELQKYSKKDRPMAISERYDLFEKEISVFLDLLRKEDINYEILSHYMMDFLRSNAFNGVASYLVFLEEERRIYPLTANTEHLQTLKDEEGLIMLTNNLYLLPNMWMRVAKTENHKHMARKIEGFAERMAWNVIQKNHTVLLKFLNDGLSALQQSRESDLQVENGIIQLIEEKARSYKKVKVDFQIINRSEYPMLLLQENELYFKSLKENKKFIAKGVLIEENSKEPVISPNNLFNAIVLNGKSNLNLEIKSHEIDTDNLQFIENLYKEKKIKLKIKVKGKTEKRKQKAFSSSLLNLNI